MNYKEIAKQLNISPASLSLILNNKPGVSDATRAAILSGIKEMGLEHLIKKTQSVAISSNLCFLIYKRHGEILDLHPFFLLLMENIENQARNFGYNILLCTIDKRKPIKPQIKHLNELDIKGVILFGTEMLDDDMEAFSTLSVPFVVMDNDLTRLSCNTVSINNQMGTYQAIEYLVQLNHKKIGYLKSRIRINSFKERHQGYENALIHFGLHFADEDIFVVSYTEEGSYRDMVHYLEATPATSLPSAFVCDDDTIAIGVMRALKEHGYRIPEDISIIGFNDRPSCEDMIPPLTSVNVSKYALAVETVNELIRLIQNQENITAETRSRKIRIGTRLVARGSTAAHLPVHK